MLWVGSFIVGLFGILAGVIPMILGGPRGGNVVATVFGVFLLVAGAYGVVAKPAGFAFRLPSLDFSDEVASVPVPAPEPERVASVPEPAPAPPEPADPAGSKDESQLQENLPQPVPVTTTKVFGSEVDPLQDPAATPVTLPAPPGDVAAVQLPPEPAPPEPVPTEAERLATLASQQTRDEAAFTKAVSDARTTYDQTEYEERPAVQAERATAICNAIRKPEVSGWIGAVKEIDKDAGGRTILSVALPDGTLVKTWNNAMSDVDDKTLILGGSPLAATVGRLSAGDTIRFSGTFFLDEPDCFRSSRLSLDQSMMEPSFLFRFTAIEKI